MIPDVNYRPEIKDLFANFWVNWETLFPALAVLLGVFFASYVLKKIKDNFY